MSDRRESSRQNAKLAAYVTNKIKMYKKVYGLSLDEARVMATEDKNEMLQAGNDPRNRRWL